MIEKNIYTKVFSILKKKGSLKNNFGIHEPHLDVNDKRSIMKALNSTFVSTSGMFLTKFENELRKITKSKYVILVNSGTSALELIIRSMMIKEKSEMIISPISFVATANVLIYNNIKPIFVDIEKNTYGICPMKLKDKLTKIVKFKNNKPHNKETGKLISGIMPTHVFGKPCEISKISKIAKKFKIPVIEDSSEALGSYYKSKHLGTFGLAGALSFNGNKIVTTGAGGAVLTNNFNICKKIRHLASVSKISHQWRFFHDSVGYNYRMPNLNAALGYSQVKKLKYLLKKKKNLSKKYEKIFKNSKEIFYVKDKKFSNSNFWLNFIEINNCELKKRNKILNYLNNKGIQARPIWDLLSDLPMFKKYCNENMVEARKIANKVILLPSSSMYG